MVDCNVMQCCAPLCTALSQHILYCNKLLSIWIWVLYYVHCCTLVHLTAYRVFQKGSICIWVLPAFGELGGGAVMKSPPPSPRTANSQESGWRKGWWWQGGWWQAQWIGGNNDDENTVSNSRCSISNYRDNECSVSGASAGGGPAIGILLSDSVSGLGCTPIQ